MNRFTRLVLKNWRNFRSVDVALAERVVVVGPNAAGKSNLLDVFRFLEELSADGGGLTNALQGGNRGGIRAVRSLHAAGKSALHIEVEATVNADIWRYVLVLQATGTPQKPGPACVEREIVERNGTIVLSRPTAQDEADPELLLATALEQRSANKDFRPLRDFLRSVEYIHVVPQLVRQPNAGDQRRFGNGLGTGLIEAMGKVAKKSRDARLKRIQRALKTVLPQFDALEWFTDDAGRPHLRAKYKHWRAKGGWQQEASFSDGTLRLIGFLWFLSRGDSPLLLEEPELSLHPAAVRQIPRIIARINSGAGRQVLMSSHSPELLADIGIDPSEILILHATDATSVSLGSSEPQLVAAAEASLPLAPIIEALTRPHDVLSLSGFAS